MEEYKIGDTITVWFSNEDTSLYSTGQLKENDLTKDYIKINEHRKESCRTIYRKDIDKVERGLIVF